MTTLWILHEKICNWLSMRYSQWSYRVSIAMNTHRNHVHPNHHQRLLWFFSFCNQRKSSSSSSSTSGSFSKRSTRLKFASNRNKFAQKYQQQLQQQQRQSSNIFGRDLTEHTQLHNNQDLVPNLVKTCVSYIEKQGIIFGIYRLSGMRVNISKLRQDFDKNIKITNIDSESISNDAHAVACVLKQYFRELPTPLLTFHLYEKFIDLFKHSNCLVQEDSNTNQSITNSHSNLDKELRNSKDSSSPDEAFHDKVQVHAESQSQFQCKINRISNNERYLTDQSNASSSASEQHQINTATNTTTTTNLATKSSRPVDDVSKFQITTTQPKSNRETLSTHYKTQCSRQFTTSVSDTQLVSLSSVVATTAADVKYQVRLDELRQLLLKLPKAHYQTLKYLIRHLAFMASKGETTGMDSKNVAIVWAPNLLKPPELSARMETLQVIGLQAVITEQLIKHHEFLFDSLDEINSQEHIYWCVSEANMLLIQFSLVKLSMWDHRRYTYSLKSIIEWLLKKFYPIVDIQKCRLEFFII